MPSPSLLARLDRIDVDTRISSSDAVRSVVGGGSSAMICARAQFLRRERYQLLRLHGVFDDAL